MEEDTDQLGLEPMEEETDQLGLEPMEEETNQLGLESIVKLLRDDTKISYDAALQIPLLTSSNETWTEAIEAYFDYDFNLVASI